jgi:hypothetical protein
LKSLGRSRAQHPLHRADSVANASQAIHLTCF